MATNPIHAEALQVFGYRGQIAALGEEAAELAAACMRLLNKKAGWRDVAEEIIGVESVIASIREEMADEPTWQRIRAEQEEKLCKALRLRRSLDAAVNGALSAGDAPGRNTEGEVA